MYLTPLDVRYIARMRPLCSRCGATATWRMFHEDPDDPKLTEPPKRQDFCTAHVPVDPEDITGRAEASPDA